MLQKPSDYQLKVARESFKTTVIYTPMESCQMPKESIAIYDEELKNFVINYAISLRNKEKIKRLINELLRVNQQSKKL